MPDRLFYAKAVYDNEEIKGMSENRKRIANLTTEEWCMEWDMKTTKIRKKYATQIKNIERRKKEGY